MGSQGSCHLELTLPVSCLLSGRPTHQVPCEHMEEEETPWEEDDFIFSHWVSPQA